MWLPISTVLVLIGIFYEDFRYRLVRILYYLILIGLLITQRLKVVYTYQFFVSAGINLIYILFLLLTCLIFIYFKYKTVKIVDHYLGMGDIFFLLASATWFEPIAFFIFNTVSFAIALLVHLLFKKFAFYSDNSTSIPLAGIQSACFIPVFIYTY